MSITKIPVRTVFDISGNPVGLSEFQVGEVVAIAQGGTSANTVANARVNLNVTDANIRNLFGVSGDLSYNNTTGIFSFTNDAGDIESVTAGNGLTGGGESGNVTLNVGGGYGITINADGVQVSNTDVRALFSVVGSGSFNNSTGVITVTGGVESVGGATGNVSNTEILSSVQSTGFFNTANIAELTNLYFTNARSIASLVGQAVSIGEATITGNLFVLGNVVEFNTETLVIEDKNIVLANGSPTAASADGAGITVDGAGATLLYVSDGDKWSFNKNLDVNGNAILTVGSSTTNLQEGTNQYFTNTRARLSVSQGSGVSYNNSTGVISANVTSINGSTGAVTGLAVTSSNLSQFASTTSAQLASIISNETGTGALVFATSPTLVTPILGTPASGTLTNATGLPIVAGTTGTLSVARGGTGETTSTGTGAVVLASRLTTANVAEVTNLYFTNSRSVGALTAGEGIDIAANGLITVTVSAGTKFSNTNLDLSEDKVIFSFNKNSFQVADFWFTLDDGTNFKNIKNVLLHNGSLLTYSNSIIEIGELSIDFLYEFSGDNIILKLPASTYVINYFEEDYSIPRVANVSGVVNFLETIS